MTDKVDRSGLGAGQAGSEPPAGPPAGRPDTADEGPPVEGLPCAEPVYVGSRHDEIKATLGVLGERASARRRQRRGTDGTPSAGPLAEDDLKGETP